MNNNIKTFISKNAYLTRAFPLEWIACFAFFIMILVCSYHSILVPYSLFMISAIYLGNIVSKQFNNKLYYYGAACIALILTVNIIYRLDCFSKEISIKGDYYIVNLFDFILLLALVRSLPFKRRNDSFTKSVLKSTIFIAQVIILSLLIKLVIFTLMMVLLPMPHWFHFDCYDPHKGLFSVLFGLLYYGVVPFLFFKLSVSKRAFTSFKKSAFYLISKILIILGCLLFPLFFSIATWDSWLGPMKSSGNYTPLLFLITAGSLLLLQFIQCICDKKLKLINKYVQELPALLLLSLYSYYLCQLISTHGIHLEWLPWIIFPIIVFYRIISRIMGRFSTLIYLLGISLFFSSQSLCNIKSKNYFFTRNILKPDNTPYISKPKPSPIKVEVTLSKPGREKEVAQMIEKNLIKAMEPQEEEEDENEDLYFEKKSERLDPNHSVWFRNTEISINMEGHTELIALDYRYHSKLTNQPYLINRSETGFTIQGPDKRIIFSATYEKIAQDKIKELGITPDNISERKSPEFLSKLFSYETEYFTLIYDSLTFPRENFRFNLKKANDQPSFILLKKPYQDIPSETNASPQ